jgi:hypothetical protein
MSIDKSVGAIDQRSEQAAEPSSDDVAVLIPKQVLGELKFLSEKMKVEPIVALRYAIATTQYIQSELLDNQATVLVKRKKGKTLEVEWEDPKTFS